MSESKPTPGPWSAFVKVGTVSVDIGPHPTGTRPCVVDWTGFDTCGLPFDQQEANARLIAAAPETAAERDRLKALNAELLAALKAVRAAQTPKDGREAMRLADAAIAKAEWEAA
jgi:hypothetical protein